ncbi:hypothetical protein [Streptomyces sp. NPDC005407]|uniref:hypothetical protein n=1 Tax=Streptomyces sp. NPDC005407 TaxID=3155340 RepID=UPI0033BE72A2
MPITAIADVVNHKSLLIALHTIRAEVESRQEDVQNLAAWAGEMTARMHGITEELKALNVDVYTVGNVHAVGDAIAGQAAAAVRYASATDTSVQQASVAARTAHRNHGQIEESVNNAPVPMATNTFYKAD